jgi:hypothetical protein
VVRRRGIRSVSGVFVLTWVVSLCVSVAALALPDGRHYEMVSPVYKGGYGVNELTGAAVQGEEEGDRVAFTSLGSFADTPNKELFTSYLAYRGTSGWLTRPLTVPATILPTVLLFDVSPALGSAIFTGKAGPNGGTARIENTEIEFFVHRLAAREDSFEMVGTPLKRLDGKLLKGGPAGDSPDFCHLVFAPLLGAEVPEDALLPEGQGTFSALYDVVGSGPGCDGGRSPRLVGVGNQPGPKGEPQVLDPYCLTFPGASDLREGNRFGAVAAGGREIFFETNANLANPECDGEEVGAPGDPAILFVRLDGEHTVEISTPISADCAASAPCSSAPQRRAMFDGANEAGSKVVFTTAQPLVTGDNDSGNDVYMATIGCPAAKPECAVAEQGVTSLVQISHDPHAGEAANVQNVSVVSRNGARVYFVAQGVLSEGPGPEGRTAVGGADNLYVYDAEDGSIGFVADLCSGPGRSGEANDPNCPGDLVSEGNEVEHPRNDDGLWTQWREVQTAGPGGRFLVFASYAQLVSGDTDGTRDVYRYDAVTGRLDRVSVGEEGFDANGNSNVFGAKISRLVEDGFTKTDYEMNYRAISEDGSRIVFETEEPLSPRAVNGLLNAYEWHEESGSSEGRVSLVSSGSDEEPVGIRERIVMTPSGRDIFFITVQGLLPQDTDGARDIYDARLGDGFPAVSASRQPCAGDACQGPLANPAPLLVPGSAVQTPGDNSAPVTKALAKPRCRRSYRPETRGKCVKLRKRGRKAATRHRRSYRPIGGGRREAH